ncbi:hypothetical protein B9G39_10315 [Zooshikella ganghwensis]|uniref:Uncharacterized protein n=2 Tax=Zooshikella ganghwensis TaxID=202772 RepID=A0A4P9VKN3_9GAMM|nr:hypothetical protein B9G39_10315 [Zooshikella ganghwensis]
MDSIKHIAQTKMIHFVVNNSVTMLQDELSLLLTKLPPENIKDDIKFKQTVLAVTYSSINKRFSKIVRFIDNFDQLFEQAMFYLRDELLITKNKPVTDISVEPSRFCWALKRGFQKALFPH